jgi:hypothetical protein
VARRESAKSRAGSAGFCENFGFVSQTALLRYAQFKREKRSNLFDINKLLNKALRAIHLGVKQFSY